MSAPEPASTNGPPPPTLEYAGPETHVNFAGTFTWHAVLWSILSTFFLLVGVMIGVGMGGSAMCGLIGCLLALAALLSWAMNRSRDSDNPRRRSAVRSGSLTGIGIGLLLVGGCFAAMNG